MNKLLFILFLFACSPTESEWGCFTAINSNNNVITYGCGDRATWEKFKMFPVYDQYLPNGYRHHQFIEDCGCD